MISPPRIAVVCVLAALVGALPGCTTAQPSGPVSITKVNPYHLQEMSLVETDDEMIRFAHRRHLYGVVDGSDFNEKRGNYYTVFWNSKNKAPATVRLEYRHASTGPEVHTKEIAVLSPKRRNATEFAIIGAEYLERGKVTQWKASIVENGVVVAEYKSFLWK